MDFAIQLMTLLENINRDSFQRFQLRAGLNQVWGPSELFILFQFVESYWEKNSWVYEFIIKFLWNSFIYLYIFEINVWSHSQIFNFFSPDSTKYTEKFWRSINTQFRFFFPPLANLRIFLCWFNFRDVLSQALLEPKNLNTIFGGTL